MAFLKYKSQIAPLCPVAVKLGQHEVHAPEHADWGVVSCDSCKDKFAIGPHRLYGARMEAEDAARQLEALLAADHKANREHANSYELPD